MTDILVITAHPDDAEFCIAGTLLKSKKQGKCFAICDLTKGERGSRGSMELRNHETNNANRILSITSDLRWNLGLPDGNIEVNKLNTLKVVKAIRHFKPKIILFPWEYDRHPDHEAVHKLVRRAYFDSGLRHEKTTYNNVDQQPHRPERMFCFFHSYETIPDFVIDISDEFNDKLKASAAYSSQVTLPGVKTQERVGEPETFISNPDFMEALIARMRHWGWMIGAKYGEGFMSLKNIPLKIYDLENLI